MSYQELVKVVQTLSVAERLSLLEVLSLSLQADLQIEGGRTSTLAEVGGILKTEGPAPTDEEIEEDYTNYLIEKYA